MSSDFDGFYAANYVDTVTMVYGFTAELAEAQDIAQEAFCRAWQRWQHVSGYDNPAGWVRHVATNLARSRWKRTRRAAAGLIRMRQTAVSSPPAEPDHVAVVAALRKLPWAQQKALVLHHIVDLPIDEVAEHLDAPIGTVKSWLHRGRSALASELRLDLRDEISLPPSSEIASRARRRKAVRGGVVAAILVVLAGIVAALGLLLPSVRREPAPPVPSRSPSPSVNAIPTLSMANTTVQLSQPYCGQPGRVSFTNGRAGDRRIGQARLLDVTGDGQVEALVEVNCRPNNLMYYSPAYLVLSFEPDGAFRQLAQLPGQLILADGLKLLVDIAQGEHNPGKTTVLRWNGASFDRSDPEGYPRIESLDLTAFASRLHCQALPVPDAAHVPFGPTGEVVTGDRVWSIEDYTWITLRDKHLYLASVYCGPSAEFAPKDKNLVLATRVAGDWAVASVFPQRSQGEMFLDEQDGDRLVLADIYDNKETYWWTGEDLVFIG